MSKDRKSFRLSSDDIDYINSISLKYNIDSTKALEKIINDHRYSNNNNDLSQSIAKDLINAIDEKYKNTITRIRLASNAADVNSLILLEMMNSLLISSGYNKNAYTSRIAKSDVWNECEKEVKRRISHFKQNKDHKKNKGNL